MKSEKKIWQALLDGETIVNGFGHKAWLNEEGRLSGIYFRAELATCPHKYSIYKKPKEMIKMYLWALDSGTVTAWFYSECKKFMVNSNGKVVLANIRNLKHRTNTFIEIEK